MTVPVALSPFDYRHRQLFIYTGIIINRFATLMSKQNLRSIVFDFFRSQFMRITSSLCCRGEMVWPSIIQRPYSTYRFRNGHLTRLVEWGHYELPGTLFVDTEIPGPHVRHYGFFCWGQNGRIIHSIYGNNYVDNATGMAFIMCDHHDFESGEVYME